MIRFCDGDVGCAEYSLLSRSKLLSYFLSGHLDEIVSVYDDSNVYIGIITYDSLLYSISIDAAIIKEYVILDRNIWRNARDIFKKKSRNIHKAIPLPVLDKDYDLICFAYQDEDANREIRMLRELKEVERGLQFKDVFPEYKCVKIHEFNELAYFLAEYLREQNIQVQVEGVMWQGFFAEEECQAPEYECLHIYAEGTWEKKRNWEENSLRSVSVEFECVDKVYETNIKNNLIKNTIGGENELLARLRGEQEIIIYGTGLGAQDAYDFLLGNGIKVCCFAVNELSAGCMHRLFGKKIIGIREAIYAYQNPVFIDCDSKYSAWGSGQVDYFDYIGYSRNERFILLKDYFDISGNGLINALSGCKVILAGDLYLCRYLDDYLNSKSISAVGYLDISSQNTEWDGRGMKIEACDVEKDAICLIAAPDLFRSGDIAIHEIDELKNELIAYLKMNNIDNYTDYFSFMTPYMNLEYSKEKYFHKELIPGKIEIGSIEFSNGTTFFEQLLDGHPNILLIPSSYCLKDNLFWICLCLSMVNTADVLPVFWGMYEAIFEGEKYNLIFEPVKFNEKMNELLAVGGRFTSQELFVMIFISYMHMCGRDIEIAEGLIYWDMHYLNNEEKEECVKWLGAERVHCNIVNIVRNACMSKGSRVKGFVSLGYSGTGFMALNNAYIYGLYDFSDVRMKKYKWSDRLIIQFEELKCHPKETLMKICEEWEIMWSDSLMETTRNGKKNSYNNGEKMISGFDLDPVYNTYEKYFSEFDRLRVAMIHGVWQRKFGYPYVELKQFSMKEIQEMFLRKYRFEDLLELSGEEPGLGFRIKLQQIIREQLKKIRMLEVLAELETEFAEEQPV